MPWRNFPGVPTILDYLCFCVTVLTSYVKMLESIRKGYSFPRGCLSPVRLSGRNGLVYTYSLQQLRASQAVCNTEHCPKLPSCPSLNANEHFKPLKCFLNIPDYRFTLRERLFRIMVAPGDLKVNWLLIYPPPTSSLGD